MITYKRVCNTTYNKESKRQESKPGLILLFRFLEPQSPPSPRSHNLIAGRGTTRGCREGRLHTLLPASPSVFPPVLFANYFFLKEQENRGRTGRTGDDACEGFNVRADGGTRARNGSKPNIRTV